MKHILAIVSLLAIHGSVLAKNVIITKSSNHKTVVLNHDDTLQVALKGNPSTGFSWDVVANNDSVLTLSEVSFEPFRSGVIGSGGTYSFTFRPMKSGKSHLKMTYERPWQKEKPPHSTFKVLVKIR